MFFFILLDFKDTQYDIRILSALDRLNYHHSVLLYQGGYGVYRNSRFPGTGPVWTPVASLAGFMTGLLDIAIY